MIVCLVKTVHNDFLFFENSFICYWTDLKHNMSGLPHHPGEHWGVFSHPFIQYIKETIFTFIKEEIYYILICVLYYLKHNNL